MKQSITIFLTILVLSGTLSDVVVFLSFKVNQDFIAEFLCVNKFEPEVMCSGKCFLNDQLDKSREKEQEIPYSVSENKQSLVYFTEFENPLSDINILSAFSKVLFYKNPFLDKDNLSGIFRPPKV
ncbi:MAG: hypothetical protein GY705_01945 [Bacteroidetes bacterium]|nr:hypothetical protein [Bacteroidota bacterium]